MMVDLGPHRGRAPSPAGARAPHPMRRRRVSDAGSADRRGATAPIGRSGSDAQGRAVLRRPPTHSVVSTPVAAGDAAGESRRTAREASRRSPSATARVLALSACLLAGGSVASSCVAVVTLR
eukprot:scaffold973_cov399-Prasinococcus_capsulatus_cf.AAC.11